MGVDVRVISSLEKVFLDEPLRTPALTGLTALRGERVSFQVACCCDDVRQFLTVAATCSLVQPTISEVKSVPVTFPAYNFHDDNYLRTVPGLYPDLLVPYTDRFIVIGGQWRCLWISVDVPADAPAGQTAVMVDLHDQETAERLHSLTVPLEVIPAVLPEQTLYHTEWFHADCLATHYQVPIFSEEHWRIIGNYMRNAANYGINTILTPVFTPPLDTQVGGERPTVQLVDVIVESDGYRFGFDRLERYMTLAEKSGLRYFEISHLFTQWGAAAAPKIVGVIDGEEKRLFGWDTDAGSEEYKGFLRAFLRALTAYLRQTGRAERCFFHVSDEPAAEMLETYKRAKDSIAAELKGFPIVDALSSYAFYSQGVVEHPIPSNDHIETFLEHGVEHLWTYYCCAQWNQVSNRFMSMPSARSRVLGWQLFKYRIEGFLHWGYNFWYSQYSRCPIDPFAETGAMDSFPAGDAFLVYPGPDGQPLSSLRQQVLFESLQDLRALRLLEALTSHEEAVAFIESEGEVAFSRYPQSAAWLLAMRERVNRRIQQLL